MIKKSTITLKLIAKNLNLSVSTVSRALNDSGNISDKTKKKITKEAHRLDYIPSNLAKGFRNGKTNIIGVIIPSITCNHVNVVLKGILSETYEMGYKTIICESNDDTEKEKELIKKMLKFRVDGILISLSKFTTDLSYLLKVLEKKTIVLFDQTSDKIPCTQVVANEETGAFNAVEHLINLGKKRIAIVKEKQNCINSEKRFHGYLKVLGSYGHFIDERLIFDVLDKKSIKEGESIAEYIINLKEKPDAIFCVTDCLAVGVIKTLNIHDIKVPDEIAVIGYSDSDYSTIVKPNLTTVNRSGNKIGRIAVKQLTEELKNNKKYFSSKSIVIETKLIVRESTH